MCKPARRTHLRALQRLIGPCLHQPVVRSGQAASHHFSPTHMQPGSRAKQYIPSAPGTVVGRTALPRLPYPVASSSRPTSDEPSRRRSATSTLRKNGHRPRSMNGAACSHAPGRLISCNPRRHSRASSQPRCPRPGRDRHEMQQAESSNMFTLLGDGRAKVEEQPLGHCLLPSSHATHKPIDH